MWIFRPSSVRSKRSMTNAFPPKRSMPSVGEERHQLDAIRTEVGQQLTERILVAQAQGRPVRVTDIALVEREQGAFATDMSQSANGFVIKPDRQGGNIRHY